MKILLLEDDRLLSQTISDLLSLEDYDTTLVYNGEDTLTKTYEDNFDLYIFDINLPDINGLDLLKELRDANDSTPTIFISANVELESITKGFKLGASDYIKKPFYPEELLLKIDTLFPKDEEIKINNLTFKPNTKEILLNDESIFLGRVQYQLFELFIKNRNSVILVDDLYECMNKPTPSALRVAIKKLKEETGLNIKNIRGTGYILE